MKFSPKMAMVILCLFAIVQTSVGKEIKYDALEKVRSHQPPETHYRPSEPQYDPPETHYNPPQPHYESPEPHYKPSKPQYDPPETHYNPPQPHYESPEPHYKPSEPQYDPPKTHYNPPEPYYQSPEPHYEQPKPSYEDPKPHYEDPNPHHKAPKPGLDPHGKGKQCVDVSTYTFPTWVAKDKKCCKTTFEKQTHPKSEKVCSDVTSQYCDVLPYTACEMKATTKKITTSQWTYKFKPFYTCEIKYEEIIHKKKKPVCTKKPKQVCNSKWKLLASGQKVWAGNEDCKTIYVEDCKLKEVPEIIKVEKPDCSIKDKVPYMTIVTKTEFKAVYKMECKVLKKNDCQAYTTKECKSIDYTESQEKPHKSCQSTSVRHPKQHLEHKKKCLFLKHDNIDHETYKL